MAHLKIDGWKTILSFWECPFSGDMLVLGSVSRNPIRNQLSNIMASQPTPPLTYPPRNKGLIRPYSGKPMVNKALLSPYFWGGYVRGG